MNQVTFTGPDDTQQYIGELHVSRGQHAAGSQFILGVVSYAGVHKAGPAASFYFYQPETGMHLGCFPAKAFTVIAPYEAAVVEVAEEVEEVFEQISLFD